MQFSDIAVSERLAFENSSFYLRPQGIASVIAAKKFEEAEAIDIFFVDENSNPKAKMSSKKDTHMLSISLTMK